MSRAARAFLDRVGHPADLPSILRTFARLPYENLTKRIKRAETGPERRMPDEVLADHDRHGAGGTCFALTWFLAEVLTEAGFQPEYLLADRSYQEAAHSALAVTIDGRRYLADPGYLLDRPFALDQTRARRLPGPGEDLILEPEAASGSWSLYTAIGQHRKFRYRLASAAVDQATFIDRWLESFEWEMMESLVLARVTATGRHYLRNVHYHRIGSDGRFQTQLDPTKGDLLREAFGVDPELFERALITL